MHNYQNPHDPQSDKRSHEAMTPGKKHTHRHRVSVKPTLITNHRTPLSQKSQHIPNPEILHHKTNHKQPGDILQLTHLRFKALIFIRKVRGFIKQFTTAILTAKSRSFGCPQLQSWSLLATYGFAS